MSILLIVSLMNINNGYVMNNLMENSLSFKFIIDKICYIYKKYLLHQIMFL